MNTDHPLSVSVFSVQIDALGQGGTFTASSVSGLSTGIECLSVQEGSMKAQVTRKGRSFCSDVVITRPFTGNKSLFEWFKGCRDKAVTKSNGSVILKDDLNKDTCRFDFTNAWPINWQGPDLNAGQSHVLAYESVVLSIENLELR